ncbi:MAG: hypothetical protein ABW096_09505 [Candidatus Thiodiazotropha sp.]
MDNSSNVNITYKAYIIWFVVIAILIAIYTIRYFSLPVIPANHIEVLILLTQILIASGVFFAGLTYYNSIQRQKIEDEKNQSKLFVDYASKNFNLVIDLLEDKNNDRVTWIRAARILLDTISLKNIIRSPEYLKAYEIEEFICRGELYKILSIIDDNRKYNPLPAAFFFGIKDWQHMKFNDVIIQALKTKKGNTKVKYSENIYDAFDQVLEISSVKAIYEFLKYGEDFKDPLTKAKKGWGDDYAPYMGHAQGAKRFTHLYENHYERNGRIYNLNHEDVTDQIM